MLDQLKATLEKSHHRLDDIIDKVEDRCEDLSEDVMELWQETKPKLRSLKETLVTATETLHSQTDEARLQAHLATMDAHDQWSYLSHTVTELAHHAQKKGQTELQTAQLQAHLAKMDTRDFMSEKGEQLSRDFQHTKETVEKASHDAAEDLERSLDTIVNVWTHTV